MNNTLSIQQITYNINHFGLFPFGNDYSSLMTQLSTYLETLTFTQLKEKCPMIPKRSKANMIELILSTHLETSSSNTTQKKKSIPKKVRVGVWNEYIGKDKGTSKCLCCNDTEIQQSDSNWESSHVISEFNGGNCTIENLRPLCCGCNRSMSSKNMKDYCLQYYPNSIDRLKLNTNQQTEDNEYIDCAPEDRMEDIPISIENTLETNIQSVKEIENLISNSYNNFKCNIQNIQSVYNIQIQSLYNMFVFHIEIGNTNLSCLNIKTMWKSVIDYINNSQMYCDNTLKFRLISVYNDLKMMIQYSYKLPIYGKKIYKWKIEHLPEIQQSDYTRIEYFGNNNVYGSKYWKQLSKFSTDDLIYISSSIKTLNDKPEKVLEQRPIFQPMNMVRNLFGKIYPSI